MSTFYKHNDKKSEDALAITDWNEVSNAVAGNQGLHLALDANDKVGIGMTSPSVKLEVNGKVKATHFIGNGASLTNLNASQITGEITLDHLSQEIKDFLFPNKMGDQKYGGIVFKVNNDGISGLVCATSDQETFKDWNTCKFSCIKYEYSDWRMPTKHELNLMYLNLHQAGLGGFADMCYWSSTEDGTNAAWYQDFKFGTQHNYTKNYYARVRAVRAF